MSAPDFSFVKENDGVHPYKKGDRVWVPGLNKKAEVHHAYWHTGFAKVDLKFDNDHKAGVYQWGAKRVEPLNAVDALGELA